MKREKREQYQRRRPGMAQWLRCHEISQGMFSDERTVTVQERGNGKIEFIVSEQYVRVQEPALRVRAYQDDSGGWWASIPTPQPESIPVEHGEFLTA